VADVSLIDALLRLAVDSSIAVEIDATGAPVAAAGHIL
jgi:hypothetical protein